MMTEQKEEFKYIRVLIIDDHFATRDMVRSILRSVGFTDTVTAEDGQHAFNVLKDGDVDMIICDWNMPVMSGIELLRRTRKLEHYKDTPFLMLTAEIYRENVEEAIKLGVNDYVAKPFTSATLIEKVTKLARGISRSPGD